MWYSLFLRCTPVTGKETKYRVSSNLGQHQMIDNFFVLLAEDFDWFKKMH
jgi:hypothetical protein